MQNALTHFLGEQFQTPPMYSAVKQEGVPLYKIAREGKSVERQPRKITLYSIEIDCIDMPSIILTIHCSSGTYIRTFAHDLGKVLETCACLTGLVRLRSGIFSSNESLPLQRLTTNSLENYIISLDASLPHFPSVVASDTDEAMIRKSGIIPHHLYENFCCKKVKLMNSSHTLICIASLHVDRMRVERLFNITHQRS